MAATISFVSFVSIVSFVSNVRDFTLVPRSLWSLSSHWSKSSLRPPPLKFSGLTFGDKLFSLKPLTNPISRIIFALDIQYINPKIKF